MVFESSARLGNHRPLSGKWRTEKYDVYDISSTDTRNWSTLGKIINPTHPITKDVNSFKGYYRLNKRRFEGKLREL